MYSQNDFIKHFEIYRHAWVFNFSPDKEPYLSDYQCSELLKSGGWMVRNTYDFDQSEKSDFWYIIKDSFNGLDELSSNDRKKIRRALKCFEYRKIEKQVIENEGYKIIKSVHDDYSVKDHKMNMSIFNDFLISWTTNDHDFWGAFDSTSGRLVGFAVIHLCDDSCLYNLVTFFPEYKHNATYPYYGFFYKLNEYYLGEKKFKYVSDGSRSITEHSNIQPFLIQNFKFRKAYCKLKLRYKWWFGIIVKILFPFRNFIPNKSVKAVLKMHEMRYKGY